MMRDGRGACWRGSGTRGGEGRGCSYSFRPDNAKSATSAWGGWKQPAGEKSPRDSHRGDRSLNRGREVVHRSARCDGSFRSSPPARIDLDQLERSVPQPKRPRYGLSWPATITTSSTELRISGALPFASIGHSGRIDRVADEAPVKRVGTSPGRYLRWPVARLPRGHAVDPPRRHCLGSVRGPSHSARRANCEGAAPG